jgi:hypothetical protein
MNKTLLFALGGAALGAAAYKYLGTEKGKELLSSASTLVKDLTAKATDFTKNSLGTTATPNQGQPS